ncbi:hypothetical protein ACIPJN_28750 [Streptomyces sp. NPDC086796]|uniref:hypothetical protein n=1 Tax=Streptomyces sp. NPDC086796 TaxID=3365760 RepID=UPI0037FE284D
MSETNVYSFLYPATVMVQIDAPGEAEADELRRSIEGEEFSLELVTRAGHRFTAITLDSGAGELDQVNGDPLEELCSNEGCRASLSDGEGYDGECGNCADRRYLHEEGERRAAPRDDCRACIETA